MARQNQSPNLNILTGLYIGVAAAVSFGCWQILVLAAGFTELLIEEISGDECRLCDISVTVAGWGRIDVSGTGQWGAGGSITYMYVLLTFTQCLPFMLSRLRQRGTVLDRSPWRLLSNDGQAYEREAKHESSLWRIILGRPFMTAGDSRSVHVKSHRGQALLLETSFKTLSVTASGVLWLQPVSLNLESHQFV